MSFYLDLTNGDKTDTAGILRALGRALCLVWTEAGSSITASHLHVYKASLSNLKDT